MGCMSGLRAIMGPKQSCVTDGKKVASAIEWRYVVLGLDIARRLCSRAKLRFPPAKAPSASWFGMVKRASRANSDRSKSSDLSEDVVTMPEVAENGAGTSEPPSFVEQSLLASTEPQTIATPDDIYPPPNPPPTDRPVRVYADGARARGGGMRGRAACRELAEGLPEEGGGYVSSGVRLSRQDVSLGGKAKTPFAAQHAVGSSLSDYKGLPDVSLLHFCRSPHGLTRLSPLPGIFDLFHFGHARALEQAKKSFPEVYLMVGVCDDKVTHSYKGKTVMTEQERYESLRHCKWVDEVIPGAPWVVNEEFLDRHRIDYVAHDALPYADTSGQADDCYGFVKRLGRFWTTQRTEGVSTSDLILRVIKDYNEYVLRNLSRGYTRQDMGVSLLKEQRIKASASMKNLREKIHDRRLAVATRIRKHMGARVRPFPTERVERNVKDFAQNVEALVDKVASGELGLELVENMDKLVSGFIGNFERSYSRLESAIRSTIRRRSASQAKIAQDDGDLWEDAAQGSESSSDALPPLEAAAT